jgi:hypothetical protein
VSDQPSTTTTETTTETTTTPPGAQDPTATSAEQRDAPAGAPASSATTPDDPPAASSDQADDDERGSETSRLAVGYPTLASGSVDPAVVELTTWLQAEGADVPITNTVTPEVLRAVVEYRRAHDVEDDADSIPGGERNRDSWIGPETWAAMVKARER